MKNFLPLSPDFLAAHLPKLDPILSRYYSSGKIHSTLLFTGLEGVGKKSIANYLVQTLFCDEKKTEPCGVCPSCKRALQNQWFDRFWFEPEMNEEETRVGVHKIDAFRELKFKLGLGPSEEPFKVVIIAEADRMTPQAANSILKVLEEPPANWLFILTASDSSRLLPTILSRCMEVRLSPLSPDSLYSILKFQKGIDFNSTRGRVASHAALGSLTRGFQYLEDDVWKKREQWLGFFSHPASEWMKLIDSISQSQQETHLSLDLLESLFSDVLQYRLIGASYPWIHGDQKELLIQLSESKNWTPEKMTSALHAIANKRKWVNLTLNTKLLAQEILSPVLEVLT